jgi:hypothetical protein
VAGHDHPAAEQLVVSIVAGERGAFIRRKKRSGDSAALRIETGAQRGPIESFDARRNIAIGSFAGGLASWHGSAPCLRHDA